MSCIPHVMSHAPDIAVSIGHERCQDLREAAREVRIDGMGTFEDCGLDGRHDGTSDVGRGCRDPLLDGSEDLPGV